MMNTQPLEVIDFSKGITDYYIDGKQQEANTMDNLLLTPNKKPITRSGSVIVNDQLPLGLFRVNKLTELQKVILAFQDKRCYRDNSGVWAEILGPTSGTFLPAGDSNSVIIDTAWQKHLLFTSDTFISPQKLFVDSGGIYRVRNAGLPDLPAGISITNPAGVGSSYLYAFCLSYSYTVGTVTYLDRGPVFYYPTVVTGGAINAGNTDTVTLPTTYAVPENWDVASWKVEIYRTTDVGSILYKLAEVVFGTASYIDNTPDTDVVNNESIYTTGNIASNETPPKAKYVHAVNDYCYWARYKDGTEEFFSTVLQSKAGDPDSVPRGFYADTEQPITGLSSIYDRPLVFCEKYIYRIDNFYGDDFSGGMILRRIDDEAGCISAQSIIRTHLGIFWAGTQGFYWSDGFRVVNISMHLNKSYQKFIVNQTRKNRIAGTFDANNHRVYWSLCKDDAGNEPDMGYVLDLRFPFLPNDNTTGGCFTVVNGGTYFYPTQFLAIDAYVYRGDIRGYVLKHGIEYHTDPKIDVLVAPASWETRTIEYLYASCFLDFGTKFIRKWVPRILISADNTTNLSLAISSSNDNNRVTGTLKPIRYKNNITWGDVLPLWGDPEALWNSQGLIEQWRRFPSGGLRCNYKQVIFQNAEVTIVNSTLLGTATVNAVANTATLGGTFNWIPGIVDYYISFKYDNYTRKFKILARTPTTITYEDLSNNDPQTVGPWDWIITGKPKGEVLLLNGYVIHWAFISKSQTPFSASSLGGNP